MGLSKWPVFPYFWNIPSDLGTSQVVLALCKDYLGNFDLHMAQVDSRTEIGPEAELGCC